MQINEGIRIQCDDMQDVMQQENDRREPTVEKGAYSAIDLNLPKENTLACNMSK